MATISGIRDALQTRLDTIEGLRPYDVATAHERMPCAVVFPAGVDALTTSKYEYRFTIEVYVSLKQGLARAQDELDGFVDPTATNSIEAAIEGDLQLASTVDTVRVDGFTSYGFTRLNVMPPAPANALMARIPLEVIA